MSQLLSLLLDFTGAKNAVYGKLSVLKRRRASMRVSRSDLDPNWRQL